MPGGRSGAVGWVDQNGDFWMFGGTGYATDGSGTLNDLWRYDVQDELWVWEFGSSLVNDGGTPTTAGNKGYPQARTDASAFTGDDGYFYLFGGNLYGNPSPKANDLWRFHPDSPSVWILLTGDLTVNLLSDYPDNIGESGYPGARNSSTAWVDDNGNFWLFGGNGYGTANFPQNLNDLWKFNTANNTWYWYGGEASAGFYPESHGSRGTPASRTGATGIKANGDLWLYGGYGNVTGFGRLHDVWKYDVSENHWILVDGSNTLNDPGIYPDNYGEEGRPPARSNAAAWVSVDEETFYIFGGHLTGENLSDIWSYETADRSAVSDWQLF